MCYINLLLTFECLWLIVSTSSNCFEALEDCVDFVDYFRHKCVVQISPVKYAIKVLCSQRL